MVRGRSARGDMSSVGSEGAVGSVGGVVVVGFDRQSEDQLRDDGWGGCSITGTAVDGVVRRGLEGASREARKASSSASACCSRVIDFGGGSDGNVLVEGRRGEADAPS